MNKLTAISIYKGVITYIDESGEIKTSLQRGIEKMTLKKKAELGRKNLLDFDAAVAYKDLPVGISLEFEDYEVQGRAFLTYNEKREEKLLLKEKLD